MEQKHLVLSSTVKRKRSRNLLVRDIGESHGIHELGAFGEYTRVLWETHLHYFSLPVSIHWLYFWLCYRLPSSIPQFSSGLWLPIASVRLDTWMATHLSVPASRFLEKGFD